jgi:hypothetical protein
LRREQEGWDRFASALARVPAARPGADPDAWSLTDVLWHVAWWCDEAARVLGDMAAGAWTGHDPSSEPGWTERVNRRELGRSRTMSTGDAREACAAGRRRMLEAFGSLADLTPAAEEWFDESGPVHYAEHVPDLERLALDPRAGAEIPGRDGGRP